MTIRIDSRTGEPYTVPRQSINDDDWYLYDRENDLILDQWSHRYAAVSIKLPQKTELLRGMKLKFIMGVEA